MATPPTLSLAVTVASLVWGRGWGEGVASDVASKGLLQGGRDPRYPWLPLRLEVLLLLTLQGASRQLQMAESLRSTVSLNSAAWTG